MSTRHVTRLLIMIAFVFLVVGSIVGGITGYFLAGPHYPPDPVAVVAPVSDVAISTVPELARSEDSDENKMLEASEASGVSNIPGQAEASAKQAENKNQNKDNSGESLASDGEDQSNESGSSVVEVVEAVQPATVRVLTNQGSGSGVIISEEGYIVTNSHVIEGAQQFAVDYARGERIPATLIGRAPEFDLAVLKVNEPVPGVAEWGDSSELPLGDQVIAIGSPLGQYQNTVTVGILSGANRTLSDIPGLLQTDAAINPGNSGGPLINRNAQIIGINTLVVRGGGMTPAQGLGFAIPSNLARNITQQIIESGSAERPLMGVQLLMLNTQSAEEFGATVNEGAYIQMVTPNGPSDLAGIVKGDVIIAVNERAVTDRDTLQMQILRYLPGEDVTITLLRDGQQVEIELTLTTASRLS